MRFQVGTAGGTTTRQRLEHPAVERTNTRETLQCLRLQLQQIGALNRSPGFFALLFVLFLVIAVSAAGVAQIIFDLLGGNRLRLFRRVGVDQPVYDFVNAHFFALDLVCEFEDFGNGHGADRVRGAAKFGINRGEGLLGLFGRVLISDGRSRLRHQQRLAIRSLVIDLDTHVVDHADDIFDLLGIEHIVGQVIVDLCVGKVATLLTEHDQRFEPHAARFSIQRRLIRHLLIVPFPAPFPSHACHVSQTSIFDLVITI